MGIPEEVEAVAVKRVISWELAEAMKKKNQTGVGEGTEHGQATWK